MGKITTVQKNQDAIKIAVNNYQIEFPDEQFRYLELQRFTKYLAEKMMKRLEDDDCYFIDFLDDITKIEW